MSPLIALLPHILLGSIMVLYLVALRKKFVTFKRKFSSCWAGCLVLATAATAIVLLWGAFVVDAVPTPNWENEARKTTVAILFGFGYEEDEDGSMLPGAANKALYRQAMSDANYKYLIMQEGVMAAARDNSVQTKIRMHPHFTTAIVDGKRVKGQYVNTFVAAEYALMKMDSLRVKRAVVYAHNRQLARAVFDLKRIAASNPKWQEMVFITPEICKTPYPYRSSQRHTCCEIIYLPIEIFISRPRDYFFARDLSHVRRL